MGDAGGGVVPGSEPRVDAFIQFQAALAAARRADVGAGETELFGMLGEAVAGLLGARRVLFGILEGDRVRLQGTPVGFASHVWTGEGLPVRRDQRGTLERIVLEGGTYRGPVRPEREGAEFAGLLGRMGVRDTVAVPWRVGTRPIGVVCAFDSEHGGFTETDELVLNAVADLAALLWEHRITELELRMQREKAEASEQAKTELLSRMSHELRTPLSAVIGFGELLQLEEMTPHQTEFVHAILSGANHLLDLVNDVLDISRIESGAAGLSLEAVDAVEVAREVVDAAGGLARSHQVTISAVAAAEPVYVLADRTRLRQVLDNLVSNAVLYNREGGSVAVVVEPAEDERARLTVRDTGTGLSPDDLARVFTPFERLGSATRESHGSGLGLTVTRILVEAMRGTIGADSVLGEGSTFTVLLETARPPQVTDSEGTGDLAPAYGGERRILYVEDVISNIRLIEQVVARRPGVRLIPAMLGSLAVDLARTHRPHLVVLDVHLPDIDGEEVLRRLQADDDTRAIPVVMLSADATPRRRERLLTCGAKAYLTKPINVRQFLGTLDALLSEAGDG